MGARCTWRRLLRVFFRFLKSRPSGDFLHLENFVKFAWPGNRSAGPMTTGKGDEKIVILHGRALNHNNCGERHEFTGLRN